MTATRDYLWRDGGAGTIEVRFGDGRFFHRFLADEPEPAAEHDCPPDRYRVRYDFSRWPRWTRRLAPSPARARTIAWSAASRPAKP